METFTKKQFWAELGEAGEDAVRERLIAGIYGSANHKKELAEEWLRVQEQARSDAKESELDSARREGLEIARSAKNAAWVAAGCAGLAVIAAVAGLFFD